MWERDFLKFGVFRTFWLKKIVPFFFQNLVRFFQHETGEIGKSRSNQCLSTIVSVFRGVPFFILKFGTNFWYKVVLMCRLHEILVDLMRFYCHIRSGLRRDHKMVKAIQWSILTIKWSQDLVQILWLRVYFGKIASFFLICTIFPKKIWYAKSRCGSRAFPIFGNVAYQILKIFGTGKTLVALSKSHFVPVVPLNFKLYTRYIRRYKMILLNYLFFCNMSRAHVYIKVWKKVVQRVHEILSLKFRTFCL